MARGQVADTGEVTENGTADGADASNATTEATALTPEEQAKLDQKRAARKARRQNRSYVVVPMPQNMKALFEEEAKVADKTVGAHVRDFLAGIKGIEIPVTVSTPRRKYATDEERDAAKKQRRESRSGTMKGLMHAFQALVKSGVSAEQATAIAAAAMASGRSIEDIMKEQGIGQPAEEGAAAPA